MKTKKPPPEPTYVDVIRMLADRGLLYATADRGPDDMAIAIADADLDVPADMLMDVSAWTLEGQRSGHEWYVCDRCGHVRLMVPEARRLCPHGTISPLQRCRGRMVRIAKRPVLGRRLREALGLPV